MKTIWIIVLLFVSTLEIQAQYRTYKHQYDVKDYSHESTDRYHPTGACFLSIVPGMGHLYVDEPVKSLIYSGMIYGSLTACIIGVSQAYHIIGVSQAYQGENRSLSTALIFGGAAGFVGSYIWSWANVTKVAKIKNMALRDKNLSFHFHPSLQPVTLKNTEAVHFKGATLSIRF